MNKDSRGRVSFFVQKEEVRVLYTNRALADIEASLGQSIIAIIQGFSSGTTGIREVAICLRAGMEAARKDSREGGKVISLDDAYNVLDKSSFASVAAVIIPAIAEMLSGDQTSDEEDSDPN